MRHDPGEAYRRLDDALTAAAVAFRRFGASLARSPSPKSLMPAAERRKSRCEDAQIEDYATAKEVSRRMDGLLFLVNGRPLSALNESLGEPLTLPEGERDAVRSLVKWAMREDRYADLEAAARKIGGRGTGPSYWEFAGEAEAPDPPAESLFALNANDLGRAFVGMANEYACGRGDRVDPSRAAGLFSLASLIVRGEHEPPAPPTARNQRRTSADSWRSERLAGMDDVTLAARLTRAALDECGEGDERVARWRMVALLEEAAGRLRSAPAEVTRKYHRTVRNARGERLEGVDMYDLLEALNVTCPARQSAILKLANAGARSGGKSAVEDLTQAGVDCRRAAELEDGRG